ncbi:hypothetical protein E2I00_019963, partial [Balaenoptera physalus]
ARGSDPGSRRQDGHGSLVEPRAEAPRKEVCREDLQSCKLSPTSGQNPKGPPSHPSWVKQPGQEETKASPGLLSIPEPLGAGSRAATGPLAWLSRRQEARLPFSRFLDEVAVRVLDPGTLEAFRGPRGRSPEPSPGEQDPGLAQEPLTGAAAPEKTLALSPQLSSEVAPEAASRGGPGRATETSVPRVGSSKRGGPAASPQRPPSPEIKMATGLDHPEGLDHLEEIRGEFRADSDNVTDISASRLAVSMRSRCTANPQTSNAQAHTLDSFVSPTRVAVPPIPDATHCAETLCQMFLQLFTQHVLLVTGSTWAQHGVLGRGRLARSSPSLWDRRPSRICIDSPEKAQRGRKSALPAVKGESFPPWPLLRAQPVKGKVPQSNYMALQRINQELEDKLYRMGQHYEEEKRALSHEIVALNSHLLEAKVTIDKLSEDNLPSEFQEHVSLHMEKQGCSLPSPLCRPAYADSVPPCVLAKVLEKPDPGSLSSHLSDASARDLAFRDRLEKPGPRPPYKGDIYCSDTALYCPEERRRDRRPSVDGPVTDVGFLRAQNSTDSAAEEEEEAAAAAYPAGYRHEAFAGYAASLPTSSSYSSFSATSMEASPEMHPGARLSPQPAFPRTGGSGLSRKDSLTKAQLYGTLLN